MYGRRELIDDDEVLMHAGRLINYGQRQRAATAIIALIYPILSYPAKKKIYPIYIYLADTVDSLASKSE